MSLPFARSTRALHTDRPYPALIVLVIAILLLGLWAAWFFWASITLYEQGQIVGATRRGTLIVAFPAQVVNRVLPGQLALLRPQGDLAKQSKGIPALVMDVRNKAVNGQIQADLALLWAQPGIHPTKDITGQVDVEVEHISPAQLVWRAAAHGDDPATVLVNPQTKVPSQKGQP